MSLCKSRSRENITAAAIVPFIEEQPTENKELRFAKEKLRIFRCGVFLSPYGDGTKKFEIELGIHQVSPPYGDGTSLMKPKKGKKKFSSPYGDGIYTPKVRDDIFVFSPPYGDGTLVYPLFL